MNKKRLLTVLGGTKKISIVCPAITPTLGDEKITNGTFDTDTAGWSGVNANLASVAGGQDGNCLEITSTAPYGSARSAAAAGIVGAYYLYSFYEKNGSQGSLSRWGISANGTDYANTPKSSATWVNVQVVNKLTNTAHNVELISYSSSTGTTLYDGVSIKPITDTGVLIADNKKKNGKYACYPTVAQFSHCGIDINYLDANNFVRAVVTRNADLTSTTNARLLKNIAGTWTEVVSAAITYVAAAKLEVRVSGTTFQLFYNGVQVGADATIDNSGLGTKIYGFNTLAGNTVGLVTANP